jgi:competence protein ComEC
MQKLQSLLFWGVAAGFVLGVFAASLWQVTEAAAFAAIALGFCSAAATLFDRRYFYYGAAASITLFAFALGIARMDAAILQPDLILSHYINHYVRLEGVVIAEPDHREANDRLSIRADRLVEGGATSTVAAGVLVVLPAHSAASYGDRVVVAGVLKTPQAFDSGEGRQFDYPSYLAAQGIQFQLSPAGLTSATEGQGNPLKTAAIDIKEAFESGLGAVLPEPQAGFAAGIDVGDKRSLGADLSKDFQRSGLIAMVVLSGYNITIVINAAYWLLARMPFVRTVRFAPLIASMAIIVFFVLIAGGATSAIRAGAMALVAAYARFSRRLFLAGRALALACVVIVLWNPYVLVFDPGFQLSALATLGLIALAPLLATWLLFIPKRWGLREIASTTAAAQLAVLPLLLYQTGSLSIYALPANFITLPFVPYAMFFALVAGVAGYLLGPLGTIAALPAYLLLSYIVQIARWTASLPFAGLSLPAFSAWWLVPCYAAIGLVAWRMHQKRKAGLLSGRSGV